MENETVVPSTSKLNLMPEAPASATLSVVTPKGYNTLFTLREMSGTALLEKIAKLEETLEKLGYKPQVKQTFGQKREVEYVDGKNCPKCGGRLVVKKKQDGNPFHQCENKKWNNFTKRNDGTCDFTDWLNPVIPATNKQNPYGNPDEVMTAEDWESLKSGKDVKPNAFGESFGTEPI